MVLVVAVLLYGVALGQEATDQAAALKVLEKLAGTWEFTSSRGMSRTVKREVVLNGAFILCKVFSDAGAPLNIKMFGYDAKEKVFRTWWFLPPRGPRPAGTMEFTGTWDDGSKTLTLTAKRDGYTLVNTTTFVDDKNHAMTVTVTNPAGKVVNRTEGKLVRQE
jgi:hypothetical protein